ncbi:MAG TPA: glycosyltransferase [Patescibacteria group bacterium]|nr:glycosyltransferase [Patescibacteria group bacterium]
MQEAAFWSVQVLAWNDLAHLSDLLSSLDEQTEPGWQMVLIDHPGTRGITDALRQERPNLSVIRNAHDRGFSKSHNQGFSFSLARWNMDVRDDRFFLISHPDVILEPHLLSRLEEAFRADPHLMIAGPKLRKIGLRINEEGEGREVEFTETLETAGWMLKKDRKLVFSGEGEEDRGQADEIDPRISPSWSCFAIRASLFSMLEKEGVWLSEFLDEPMPIIDLVWRTRLLGFSVRMVPGALAWHHAHERRTLDKKRHLAYKRYQPDRARLQTTIYLLELKNGARRHLIQQAPWLIWGCVKWAFVSLRHPRQFGRFCLSLGLIPDVFGERWQKKGERRISPKSIRSWFV